MLLKYGMPVVGAIALGWALMSVKRMTPVDAKVLPPSPPPVAAYPNQVGAVGLVEASSENISVSLPVPGLVTSVLVKAGDTVRRGQPLFTLDDRDLRAELALCRSTAELAEKKLQRLEASPRPEEIPPAEARVREAQAQLGDAQTQLQMMEAVKDKRAIRKEDLERRQSPLRRDIFGSGKLSGRRPARRRQRYRATALPGVSTRARAGRGKLSETSFAWWVIARDEAGSRARQSGPDHPKRRAASRTARIRRCSTR